MRSFRLRPSAAGVWVHCPGSVTMQEQYPDTSGMPALEGEASHWVVSETLSGRGATKFLGAIVPNGVIVTQEMIDAARVMIEAVLNTGPQLKRGHVEEQIAISRIHSECGGTPDWWWYDEATNTVYIVDYKYGYGIVDPWNNWQLITYAIGVIDHITGGNGIADQNIRVVMKVVQPRPYHHCGPVREWVQVGSDLRAQANMLYESAQLALGGNPKCVSGEQCRYCSARHACVAAQRAAQFGMDYTFQATPYELSAKAAGIEYRSLKRAFDAIKTRMTGIEEQILKLCRDGKGAETGLMIDRTMGNLKWKSESEILAAADLLGIDISKPKEPKTPKQVLDKHKDFPKSLVDENTERTAGTEKLVPADKTLAAQVFTK